MSTDKLYVVIKRGLFWRPEDKGYTAKIEEAGRYTKEEAESRCHGGEQPVTMALASSFQTQESLQAEVDSLRARLAVADAALAEARGLVEFLNKPLPVNSRAALVERCYQVQLICETISPHENQTKTAIALSELVTAIRESGGRDETLADLAKAREDAAGFQADLQLVQRENAALLDTLRLVHRWCTQDQLKLSFEGVTSTTILVAMQAALHPATKEGKAE